jgi:succinyl-CoA synthetase beta subunit
MNIHEYQAKELLKQYNVNVLDGVCILNYEDIDKAINNFNANLYVVKAQIHAGGRGKAGGVKLAKTKEQAISLAQELWGKTLVTHQTTAAGQKVQRLYVEAGCDIKKEYYLSLVLDRSNSCITCIVSSEGGVDIEEVAHNNPEKIHQFHINPATGLFPFHLRQAITQLNINNKKAASSLSKVISSSYEAMLKNDAMQLEINPLVLTADDEFVVLDAKMNFDDNALFKHKNIEELRDLAEEDELETRAQNHNLSYVRMDGNIGCMVNGAGLAMATMDIIQLYGASPANFLDVGGGADQERVTEALKIILADDKVEAILVNIFGGIMRCDIIARGIIEAVKELSLSIPIVVRLAGTNSDLGKDLLASSGLSIVPADDLSDAAMKVVALVKK